MNAENFPVFLQDPSKLYQIPYQELKSLVVQYPYCQPLRILLLQKSQMERHPDFERNLQMAAAYMPDRRFLRMLVREFKAMEAGESLFELEEERLELKALSEIFAQREAIEQAAATFIPLPPTPPSAEEVPLPPPPPIVEIQQAPAPKPAPPRPAPAPKNRFSSWQTAALHSRTLELKDIAALAPAVKKSQPAAPAPKQEPEKKSVQAQDLARRSIEEKEDLVSETLAGLLARQGHHQRAIQMYEKLCLIFPEKSSFFAQKIELLKRK